MGQIVIRNQVLKCCNIVAIQPGGSRAGEILANGEVWLVDTTNAAKVEGRGLYDSYIEGDGRTAAKDLAVKKIDNIPDTDPAPASGSSNPVSSGGVYNRLEEIEQNIDELAENIAYIDEDDGEGGAPSDDSDIPADLSDYAQKTWVNYNFISKSSIDTVPTVNSVNPVTSDGVKRYVDAHGGGSTVTTFTVATVQSQGADTYDFGTIKYSDILYATQHSDEVILAIEGAYCLRYSMNFNDYLLFSAANYIGNGVIVTMAIGQGDNDSVNASSEYITVPTELRNLSDDSIHRTVTDEEKAAWNGKAKITTFSVTSSEVNGTTTYDFGNTKFSDIVSAVNNSDMVLLVLDGASVLSLSLIIGNQYEFSNSVEIGNIGVEVMILSEGSNDSISVTANAATIPTDSEKALWNAAAQSIITISESNLDTATTLGIYKVTGTAGALLQNSKPYLMLVNEYNVTTMRPTVTTTHYICQTRFQGSLITQRRKADGGTWSEWADAFEDIKALKSDVRVIPIDSSSYGDLDAIDHIAEGDPDFEVPLTGLFYVTIQHEDGLEAILVNQHWNEDLGVRQVAYTKDGIKTRFWDEEVQVWDEWEWVRDDTKADKVEESTANNAAALDANGNLKDSGVPAAGIPFGRVDSTSTATAFTATVPGITELRDGVCVLLENGVVTSAAGFTLNINNLGAKPSFNNLTAATRDTTIFNVNYTMLFVYDATRVVDGITGAWCCYRGYDANTNTLGYQIRTNSSTLPVSDQTGRYRLLFTSADGSKYVPATTSTSTNATSSRAVNQRPIDPHGAIVYYSSTTVLSANGNVGTSSQWQQYTLTLGYSFNRTGAALVLSYPKPVYVKCTPQTDGSAIIDADTPYVQALPTTADGKIYIHLGRAYSATAIELTLDHPVYHYYDGAIRRWLGPV